MVRVGPTPESYRVILPSEGLFCLVRIMIRWFTSKRPEPQYETPVELARVQRREQLRIDLARLNAEAEELSHRIGEFLFEHTNLGGGYKAASLEELGTMPDRHRELRLAEFVLNERRAALLRELSELMDNPRESRHIAGRLVDHA